jgi:hypothetical protein
MAVQYFSGPVTNADVWGIDGGAYADARATCTVHHSGGDLKVGQDAGWMVARALLEFNTSTLPAGCRVIHARLSLGARDVSGLVSDFDVQIRDCTWASPVGAGNREASYDAAIAGAYLGDWRNTAGVVINTGYWSSILPASCINPAGMSQFSLTSEEDANASQPAGDEFIIFWGADQPVLEVTYAEAVGGPASLLKAIRDRFTAAGLGATFTGLYLREAPVGTARPYLTFAPITGQLLHSMGDFSRDQLVQFDLWYSGESAKLALAAAELVTAAYDECTLTIAGHNHIRMFRDMEPILTVDEEADAAGWRVQVDYHCWYS